ncbi:MAG TPA: hypothetical protein VN924_26830 [Bryobacteraceae bacterium]|nr:hypothetical protein [Bryobacteraceae bacterium]
MDGTRVRANCSQDSLRQGGALTEYLEQAAAHVAQVERAPEGEIGQRQEAARRGGSRAGRSG